MNIILYTSQSYNVQNSPEEPPKFNSVYFILSSHENNDYDWFNTRWITQSDKIYNTWHQLQIKMHKGLSLKICRKSIIETILLRYYSIYIVPKVFI